MTYKVNSESCYVENQATMLQHVAWFWCELSVRYHSPELMVVEIGHECQLKSYKCVPCSVLKVNGHFEGTCHLHIHGRRISQARMHCESSCKHINNTLFILALTLCQPQFKFSCMAVIIAFFKWGI
jgi:hypothetical protein